MKKFSRHLKKVIPPSKKRKEGVGLPPGTLIYTGDKIKEKTKIKVTDYNEEFYEFQEFEEIQKDLTAIKKGVTRWIDIHGLAEVNVIEEIGRQFNLHPLVLEDILSTNQLPKLEDYGKYIFIIMRKLIWNDEENEFDFEQTSLILGENYVISLQERDTNLFDPIYERIRVPKGRVRSMKSDYLYYVLIDIIVDNYFIVLEKLGEDIENVEDILVKNPDPVTLQLIYGLKKSTIELRKSIWPIREVINKLQREQSSLLGDELQIYLRDIYDHIFRISDLLENNREIVFGMLDMYLSSVSNRMNDIMKVLTIISTIFIPLSFLAGFYGMNFKDMPEFSQPSAYPILIIVMILIAIVMLYYFRRKRWL